MTTLTQGIETGEYLMSEGPGTRSRDAGVVTVSGNEVLRSGRVMAKLTATGKWVPYDNVGTDGSEVAAGVLLTPLLDGVNGDFAATLHVRDAEVITDRLSWGAVDGTGQTAGLADLKALGIIAR